MQQRRLKEDLLMTETDVNLFCDNTNHTTILHPQIQNGSHIHKRCHRFHVKTQKVDWEGINSYLHVFIDTTNIVKLEEAKNNIKCQKIMFASVSHEFRTPLNAIMNSYQFIGDMFEKIMSECIKSGVKKKEVATHSNHIKRFIKMGNNSSVLLLALIDDILDLSKMEAGTFTINNSYFKIKGLIEEVYDIFNTQCEQKGLLMNLDIDKQLIGADI